MNGIRVVALQHFELRLLPSPHHQKSGFATWVIVTLFTYSVMRPIAIWPHLTPLPLCSAPWSLAGFVGVFVVLVFAVGIFT